MLSSSEGPSHEGAHQLSRVWIDITVPLRDGMVHWPSDPPLRIQRVLDMAHGDSHTLSKISMGSHTGTHVDAPLHMLRNGLSVDKVLMDTMIGRARVLEIRDTRLIRPAELAPYRIRRGERILFKTRNSGRVWRLHSFTKSFVSISREAAEFLAERQIRLVGVDYLSVGSYNGDGLCVHEVLLGAGIGIIEGLDLSQVSPGKYDLICLPLRTEHGDGAPARAIIRRV